MSNPVHTRGENIDELLVKDTNVICRTVVPVYANNSLEFSSRLQPIQELLTAFRIQELP